LKIVATAEKGSSNATKTLKTFNSCGSKKVVFDDNSDLEFKGVIKGGVLKTTSSDTWKTMVKLEAVGVDCLN